jgi:hypothetical protein
MLNTKAWLPGRISYSALYLDAVSCGKRVAP